MSVLIKFFAWEQSKQLELNDKMDLASYLLKPVQRMGKYALLLQQLMKACNTIQVSDDYEGSPWRAVTKNVLSILLRRVNL